MTPHRFLLAYLAALAFACAADPPITASTEPNIVYVLADDLGYGDVRVLNPNRGRIPTPTSVSSTGPSSIHPACP